MLSNRSKINIQRLDSTQEIYCTDCSPVTYIDDFKKIEYLTLDASGINMNKFLYFLLRDRARQNFSMEAVPQQ